jgi:putative hydrolase
MKPLFDLHTHTIASGHAYSSLKENIEAAAERGLTALGISDHAPAMPGTCHSFHFGNSR